MKANKIVFCFFTIILINCLIGCSNLGKLVEVNDNFEPCDVITNENCYKIYSDLHIFGKKPINVELTYEKNTFYLGDIYDLKHAKDENECKIKIDELRTTMKNNYVRGNHELYYFENGPYYYIKNGILFTHGHKNICYSDYKVKKWEENGNRGIWNKVTSELTSIPYIGKKGRIARAVKYAKDNNCHTVVFGHTHVKKTFDRTYQINNDKIRVINVPRGITYLLILSK